MCVCVCVCPATLPPNVLLCFPLHPPPPQCESFQSEKAFVQADRENSPLKSGGVASSPLRRRSVDQPKGPQLSPAVGVQPGVGGVTGVVKQRLLSGGGGDDVNRDNSPGKVASPLRRRSLEGSLEGLPSPAAGVVRQEGEEEEGAVRVFTAVEGSVSGGGGDAVEKEGGRDGDLPLQGEEVSSSLRVSSGVEPEGLPSVVTGAVQAVGVVQEVDGVAGGPVEEGAKDEQEPKVRMDRRFVLR